MLYLLWKDWSEWQEKEKSEKRKRDIYLEKFRARYHISAAAGSPKRNGFFRNVWSRTNVAISVPQLPDLSYDGWKLWYILPTTFPQQNEEILHILNAVSSTEFNWNVKKSICEYLSLERGSLKLFVFSRYIQLEMFPYLAYRSHVVRFLTTSGCIWTL